VGLLSGFSPVNLTPTIAVAGDGDGDGAIDGVVCGPGAGPNNVVYPPPPQPAATAAASPSASPAYLVLVAIPDCLTIRSPFDFGGCDDRA
jgi:hypothetical protein